ncbi:response regulator [Sphingobacteriaceae bacterium]|nr:response regulator [Sphingobacteriaceae bacterium]
MVIYYEIEIMKSKDPLKIFVIDDDVMTLNLLLQHLKNIGYNDVTPFEKEHNGLNSLCFKPDVIFIDYQLELLDGLELLKRIRRTHPTTYIVMLSGQSNIDVVVNCFRYGAFDYIIKNSNQESRIKQVLDKINEERKKNDEEKSLFQKIKNLF